MTVIERLRDRAAENRMLLSVAQANYRRAKQEGRKSWPWLAIIIRQRAKMLLPWNWLGTKEVQP